MPDPTQHRTPRRGRGRPARTSMGALIDAAIELGLDRFTIGDVAARAGVGESTVYGYVASREALHTAAAGHVFHALDVESDAETWREYVAVVSQRAFDLAAAHDGLRDYVLFGPYSSSTVATFEAIVDGVRARLPDVSETVAWVLASRPLVQGLVYLGDDILEPMAAWIRDALLIGFEEQLARGELPAETGVPWRSRIRVGD